MNTEIKFQLTAFDPETDELVMSCDLPGFTEVDLKTLFYLREDEDFSGCHIVRSSQKSDLEKVSGQKIDLNEYDYFVEDYQEPPIDIATRVIQELLEAAEQLEEGGVFDCLSHGPDGGRRWRQAIEAAEDFLHALDENDEEDPEIEDDHEPSDNDGNSY